LVHSVDSKGKRFDDESKPEDEKNKKNKSKRVHITVRTYNTGHGRNRTISKWQ